jgi:hypothetical protein
MSHISNSTGETEEQMMPGVNVSKQPGPNHLQNAVSSLPAETGGENPDLVADTGSKYAATGDAAATHGVFDPSRGATWLAMDEAW